MVCHANEVQTSVEMGLVYVEPLSMANCADQTKEPGGRVLKVKILLSYLRAALSGSLGFLEFLYSFFCPVKSVTPQNVYLHPNCLPHSIPKPTLGMGL